jgi:hypothetical protein
MCRYMADELSNKINNMGLQFSMRNFRQYLKKKLKNLIENFSCLKNK